MDITQPGTHPDHNSPITDHSTTDHSTTDHSTTEHSVLPIDGGIQLRQDGPRDARTTLVLVHGSASSINSWESLVPLVARTHRVISVDLLGHGRSAKPDDGDYRIEAQGRRVGEVLDRLEVDHAIVVGHSTGGSVATALAEQRPGLVSGLVLVNSGPHLDAYIAPPLGLSPADWPLSEAQIRLSMAPAFSREGYRPPQQLIADVAAMTFHSLSSTMQEATRYLDRQTLPSRLAVVEKPLQVIFGADDRRWRSSSAGDYRAVDGAQVHLLDGLGHSPMLEDPVRTAELLLRFVAMHQAPAEERV